MYVTSRKTNESNLRKWQKNPSFWPDFGTSGPNLGCQFFFFFFSKIWLRQSLDIMVSYHHVQYHKKLMIQSWKNFATLGCCPLTSSIQWKEWFILETIWFKHKILLSAALSKLSQKNLWLQLLQFKRMQIC